ncbi:MAG: response regulator [Elusimicrobia bacterium]|nr:response regulator [Elusimicrobiota bacterium]
MDGPVPRALIVEGDPEMSGLFQRCLGLWGWHADCSRSVQTALELFRRNRHDLAVCDADLPASAGIFLARALLKERPTLRVVLVSDDPGGLDPVARAGLGAVLRKPFDLGALKALVQPEHAGGETYLRESDAAATHREVL